ncbi:hypothetical protein PspTeo4_34224 [Pseudomonas sp. Teo4]|nr:hypothetical protein [Pseudomonas sp. Teo4]
MDIGAALRPIAGFASSYGMKRTLWELAKPAMGCKAAPISQLPANRRNAALRSSTGNRPSASTRP